MDRANWDFGKKKNFKKSVHRNRIKRLLRASFLLNKFILEEKIERINCSYHIVFIYIGKFLPKFQDINPSIKKIFNLIKDTETSSLLK